MQRWIVRAALAAAAGFMLAATGSALWAEDLFLAEKHVVPGRLLLSEGGTEERAIHYREAVPNPAYPHAVMKLAQAAIGPDGKVYFCSGLDGSLMHLLDGKHEIQAFEFPGQIRDLACTGEEHTIYFSVLPTPQNGEPLADGKIYRRDLWEGQPTEIATIRQADVGGAWWGTFTIRNGAIYLATLDTYSRLFRLTDGRPEPVFTENVANIQGLTTGPDGDFYFVTGLGDVFRTQDFAHVDSVLSASRGFTEVSLRAATDAPRP